MDYKEAYYSLIERLKEAKEDADVCDERYCCVIDGLIQEQEENEDERIRKDLIEYFKGILKYCGEKRAEMHKAWIAWLEKQGNKVVDCPQKYRDSNHPNGCVVLEDFNGGEGFYKLNLDYLNKKQVEEVEEMVRVWNNEESKTSDEDIKSCIGMCLTDVCEQRFKDYNTSLKDCLAWLEKQKPIDENEFAKGILIRIAMSIMQWLDANLAEGNMCLSNMECEDLENAVRNADWQKVYGYMKKKLEKQGIKPQGKPALEAIHDQNPDNANKVERKFKVGDFIVNDYCKGKVIELTTDAYLLDTEQGIPFSCEHNAHLWSIQDAKDGDVLVDVYGNIGIFQKNYDFDWMSYCSLGINGGFQNFEVEHENEKTYPATKEQRDTLERAMTNAGYRWNKEELKLEKI